MAPLARPTACAGQYEIGKERCVFVGALQRHDYRDQALQHDENSDQQQETPRCIVNTEKRHSK